MARTGIRASAIIIKDDKILLIHRRKDGEEYWVFPGGGVEDNETAKEACIREVKEETNLDVKSVELAFINATFENGNKHPFYFCEVSNNKVKIIGEEKEKSSLENSYELKWIDMKDIKNINLVPENAKEKILKLHET